MVIAGADGHVPPDPRSRRADADGHALRIVALEAFVADIPGDEEPTPPYVRL